MSAITIHSEKNELIWNKASEFLINWLRLYHNIGQKTLFLLSGGSVVKIYSDLAKFINTSDLDFDFLAFAQIDERKFNREHLTFNRENVNAYQIENTGLFRVCDEKNIPYYLISQEGMLGESAEKYNKQLKDLFEHATYKIGVLGIGEDSHTAGLLPGYKRCWDKNKLAVGYEIAIGQNSARAEFCQQNIKHRITITPYALIQLDQAVTVAVGEKKKEALKKINDMKINDIDKYPAAILQKMKKVDLFTDINL